jgi:hypothetical protein
MSERDEELGQLPVAHAVHVAAPLAAAVAPSGQRVHVTEPVAPAAVPGAHALQDVAPGDDEKEPVVHGTHVALDVAPSAPLDVPDGHATQTAAPVEELPYVPGGHGRHAVKPDSDQDPTAQDVQAPDADAEPPGHEGSVALPTEYGTGATALITAPKQTTPPPPPAAAVMPHVNEVPAARLANSTAGGTVRASEPMSPKQCASWFASMPHACCPLNPIVMPTKTPAVGAGAHVPPFMMPQQIIPVV